VHVCVVTTTFPRWSGDGQGPFVWGAVQGVRDLGVDVRVVTMHNPGSLTRESMQGIEVWRPRYWWPERAEALRREGGGLPVMWEKYPLVRAQVIPFGIVHSWNVGHHARDCDLIHAHWSLSAAAALASKPAHRRPIMVTLQGSDLFRAAKGKLGARLTREVLLRCDLVTVLSGALADKAFALGVPEERVEVLPNGVDTQRFTPGSASGREPVILFVGSLIERKGVRFLFEAMPDVFAAHPEYRLVILGEGPQEAALRALAEKLGCAKRITFTGFQTQDDVKAWLQRSRLLVLPSLEEGQGVVLLEAIACGTPVVASRVDGIVDVVTPEVGRLVPPAQPGELSAAISEMVADEAGWTQMSVSARARAVEVYDWRLISRRYVDLYRRMVDGKE
jgi:glycosyltransferase involved in cell wall biosynthesis